MNTGITAFILAGGKSSRMGTDKGLYKYNGIPLIRYVIDTLREVFATIIIVSNNQEYKQFGLDVINDDVKDIGPIGGISTALRYTSTEKNFFIACDMPFIHQEIVKLLIANADTFDAVIPLNNNNPEPLCALYSRNKIAIFEKCISEKDYKIRNVYKLLNYKLVDIPQNFLEKRNPFLNINSINDFPNSFE